MLAFSLSETNHSHSSRIALNRYILMPAVFNSDYVEFFVYVSFRTVCRQTSSPYDDCDVICEGNQTL
jgi:hypothetical protein